MEKAKHFDLGQCIKRGLDCVPLPPMRENQILSGLLLAVEVNLPILQFPVDFR
jgi:hypothetical protein